MYIPIKENLYDSNSRSKKEIIMCSFVGLVIATATYFAFTTTNDPAIAAALPALLSFATCPLMCAGIGSLIWFSRRSPTSNDSYKGNRSKAISTDTKEEVSCCGQEILQRINKNQNEIWKQQQELSD